MSLLELELRPLSDDEILELQRGSVLLSEIVCPPGLTTAHFRDILGELLRGTFSTQDVPRWTQAIWDEESIIDPTVAVRQQFDSIISNSDLSRLSYFARSRAGRKIAKQLKEAWCRVTLAHPTSLYSLIEGETCLMYFPSGSFHTLKQTSDRPLTDAEAGLELFEALESRTHNP